MPDVNPGPDDTDPTELLDRLSHLRDGHTGSAPESAVSADIARGRRALGSRRARRLGVTGAALGVVAIAALSYAATAPRPDRPAPPLAGGTTSSAPATTAPASTAPMTTTASASATPGTRSLAELVAYNGHQVRGFEVAQVPRGYVVQGTSGAVIAIAKPGDKTPIDQWRDKLVVTLDDHPTTEGTPVWVGRRPGTYVTGPDGTQQLWYSDGRHYVNVQSWGTLGLTTGQVVRFAQGVTVTTDAVESHG